MKTLNFLAQTLDFVVINTLKLITSSWVLVLIVGGLIIYSHYQ